MGKNNKQVQHHEYPNEYQFEIHYAHQTESHNRCQHFVATKTIHSKAVFEKPELSALVITWLADLPESIDVGGDRLEQRIETMSLRSSYVNQAGHRMCEDWKLPMAN